MRAPCCRVQIRHATGVHINMPPERRDRRSPAGALVPRRLSTGWVCWLLTLALPPCASAGLHFASADADVDQTLTLVDRRLGIMPAVAAWKWQNRVPIADAERERAVAARAVELAKPLGLRADGIQRLFDLQVRLAREVQASLHGRWAAGGFDFPQPVPSLEGDLRPRLDQISTDLLRAAYRAAPLLEARDFASHYALPAAQRLTAQGWSDTSRQELLAALSQIRRTPVPALERIAAAGVLRIGTTGDYAPFSIEAGGELTGADVELAAALAARLGAQPVFIRTSWRALLADLHEDRFDLAMGGIAVTPARAAQAAFSIPYATGGKTLIARCRDARRYTQLAAVDQPGVRVIVNPGGTNEQYVRANLHRAAVRIYSDNRTIFEEIRAGRADVMITDDVEVELQTRRHTDLCRPLRGTLTRADKAVLLPRDPTLVAAVNAWLAASLAAGEPARLIETYGGAGNPAAHGGKAAR